MKTKTITIYQILKDGLLNYTLIKPERIKKSWFIRDPYKHAVIDSLTVTYTEKELDKILDSKFHFDSKAMLKSLWAFEIHKRRELLNEKFIKNILKKGL